MGVKFAGSRSLDERRRRRLAGENDTSSPASGGVAPRAEFWNKQRASEEIAPSPDTPLASLLPASTLRIWGLCAAIPLFGLLLVIVSGHPFLVSDQRLQVIFDLQQGHLWRFLRGVLFLGASGLCWLVSWYRSASDRDFEGRFKSWYFSGWIFLLFGFIAGCDGHWVFAQIIGDYTQLQQPFLKTLFWAVPMAAMMLEPMRCFTLEMWHCRRSCLMLALCCFSAVAYLELKLPLSEAVGISTAERLPVLLMLASLLTPMFLFSALLSQMHYVMYVSADPVRRRKSWTWMAINWLFNKGFSGARSLGHYCYLSILRLTCSTRARLKNRSEQAKKSRAERKAERILARQKIAEEKGLRKRKPKQQDAKTESSGRRQLKRK